MSKTPWLDEAEKDLGIKEIPGRRHNPRVVEMFAQSGHPWVTDDETAWCSAAMNAWVKQAGMVGTGSLAARSWLQWGKSLNKKVKRGAIAVFKRGNSSWQGHVAVCTGKETRTHVEVLGGNQRNAVNVRMYPKSKLLDTRWPSTLRNSRTVKASAGAAGTATALMAADVAGMVQPAAEAFDWDGARYIVIACIMIIAFAGLIVYFRWDDIKEKGR
jgi:uncharacterized protein (TIGR02594 family)